MLSGLEVPSLVRAKKGGAAKEGASEWAALPHGLLSLLLLPPPVPSVPQPLHVVCPEQYTQPPPAQAHRMDLMIDCQPPPMSYRRAEVLALPFKRRYEKIEIMPEVSGRLLRGNSETRWSLEAGPGLLLGFVSNVCEPKSPLGP